MWEHGEGEFNSWTPDSCRPACSHSVPWEAAVSKLTLGRAAERDEPPQGNSERSKPSACIEFSRCCL